MTPNRPSMCLVGFFSYKPDIVLPDGTYQRIAVHTAGKPTVEDNRKALNAIFFSGAGSEERVSGGGSVYYMPRIVNEERYTNTYPEWSELTDEQKAQFGDELNYNVVMFEQQATSVPVSVNNGEDVNAKEFAFNKANAQHQYANMLSRKEELTAQIQQAERMRTQLKAAFDRVSEANKDKRGSFLMGDYNVNQFRTAFTKLDDFITNGKRMLANDKYSSFESFIGNFTDDGWTFGILPLMESYGLNDLASGDGVNPEILKAFGGKEGVKRLAASVDYFRGKANEFKEKLGYNEESGAAHLVQFGLSTLVPLGPFNLLTVPGRFVSRGMTRLLTKAGMKLAPKVAAATEGKIAGYGLKAAYEEGGVATAGKYALNRLGNTTTKALALTAQGAADGVTLTCPEIITNVVNDRTGQANVVKIDRGGLVLNGQPLVHQTEKSEGDIMWETLKRGEAEWIGMRLGEIFMPLAKAVDGKVVNLAKDVWNNTVGKFINASSFGKITAMIRSGKSATYIGKYIEKRFRQAGMGGSLTFYAQGNISNALNALWVGDVSWDEVTANQMDKFVGAMRDNAIMVGLHSTIGTVGYMSQVRDLRKTMAKLSAQGEEAFGESWVNIKADIDACKESDNALFGYMNGVRTNKGLTKEQRNALLNYCSTIITMQGLEYGAANNSAKDKASVFGVRYYDAYTAGMETKSPDQIAQLHQRTEDARWHWQRCSVAVPNKWTRNSRNSARSMMKFTAMPRNSMPIPSKLATTAVSSKRRWDVRSMPISPTRQRKRAQTTDWLNVRKKPLSATMRTLTSRRTRPRGPSSPPRTIKANNSTLSAGTRALKTRATCLLFATWRRAS